MHACLPCVRVKELERTHVSVQVEIEGVRLGAPCTPAARAARALPSQAAVPQRSARVRRGAHRPCTCPNQSGPAPPYQAAASSRSCLTAGQPPTAWAAMLLKPPKRPCQGRALFQATPQRTGMLEQAPCCSARITAPKQRTRKAVSALRVHRRAAWRGRTAWQAARLCAPSTATATSTDRPVHRACASRWLLPPQPHGCCCSARRRAASAPPHPPPRQDGPATATDAGHLIRTGTNACRTGKGGRQPARQLPAHARMQTADVVRGARRRACRGSRRARGVQALMCILSLSATLLPPALGSCRRLQAENSRRALPKPSAALLQAAPPPRARARRAQQ